MTDRFTEFENDLENQPTFEDALEELKTDDESLPSPALIVGLSGLSQEQLSELAPVWEGLGHAYRRILMQMLVDAAVSNFRLNYHPIGYATLTSPQPDVRQAAIELLAEDESRQLLRHLMHMATDDPAENVRAEATRSLGRFVLAGEMGNIDEDLAEEAQETLMRIIGNAQEDLQVRRYAVESIANCTREGLPQIIREAYNHLDSNMRLSAVVAMGRSCDPRWENQILEELDNSDDEFRIAATRSAGELQLDTATQQIIKNIELGEREEQEVAIVALGEIGGKEVMRVLQSLLDGAEEAGDPDLIDLIDNALGIASLVNGDLMMVDFTDLDQ